MKSVFVLRAFDYDTNAPTGQRETLKREWTVKTSAEYPEAYAKRVLQKYINQFDTPVTGYVDFVETESYS